MYDRSTDALVVVRDNFEPCEESSGLELSALCHGSKRYFNDVFAHNIRGRGGRRRFNLDSVRLTSLSFIQAGRGSYKESDSVGRLKGNLIPQRV